MNPYLAKDIAYAEQQDREWLRELAIEQRAAEILADPRELSCAIGDYGTDKTDMLTAALGVARTNSEIMATGIALQNELERIATQQAEDDLYGKESDNHRMRDIEHIGFWQKMMSRLPALLRRQAE